MCTLCISALIGKVDIMNTPSKPKTSESILKAVKKYQTEKTDEIRFRMPKGWKATIENYAKNQGKTVTGFLSDLVKKEIGQGEE